MIIYYSGTGNSEFVAEQLGEILDDKVVNLLPMLRGEDKRPLRSKTPWVVVSPVYESDMAAHLRRWLTGARLQGNRRIYFVFTTGKVIGNSGYTSAGIARKKGMKYMGSTKVIMPVNYPLVAAVKNEDACRDIIRQSKPQIEEAAEYIRRRTRIPEEAVSPLMGEMVHAVVYTYNRFFIHPKLFYSTEQCISCGKCAAVCSMKNITMKDGRPVWGDHCVHCMACVSGCPKEAVEYGRKILGKRRYHIPKDI